ncbi:hypothetical protein PULV_a0457 [Pseudoalteromonas ulvae UL12]|uniref:TRAP transporter small permease subunit n=1 Tax=Pseudoalteromonas ulvae TaxID=107327 RepID=UPI0019F9EE62|nr:TRAP transporter small permease subunit [Pseudoalteromonas ulvae]MBE0362869.1 hypothetical protein [Pseudoalteromonas ulvae UL12]
MRKTLLSVASYLDSFTERLGQCLAWSTCLMVLIMTSVVILRYVFNLGWIAMQESIIYIHASVFMLGCGYALKYNEHVRVDVLYRHLSQTKQAWVDCFGIVFLLIPTTVFILWSSYDYVLQSWQVKEGSIEAGGIPGVYLLKTLLFLFPVTLLLQAIAQLCRVLLTLMKSPDVDATKAEVQ